MGKTKQRQGGRDRWVSIFVRFFVQSVFLFGTITVMRTQALPDWPISDELTLLFTGALIGASIYAARELHTRYTVVQNQQQQRRLSSGQIAADELSKEARKR